MDKQLSLHKSIDTISGGQISVRNTTQHKRTQNSYQLLTAYLETLKKEGKTVVNY